MSKQQKGDTGPSPIFIFGVPRSGTTLLYRTLLRHSAFRPQNPIPASFFVESKVFQFASNHNHFLKPFMGGDERLYASFLKQTRGTRFLNRLYRSYPFRVWMEARSPMTRQRWWKRLRQDKLVQTYFGYVREGQHCNRVLEKTPIHYAFLPEILATFPEAKFIWIHRHPIDVYGSYRRRGQDERDHNLTPTAGSRWLSVTPQEFTRRYIEGIDAMHTACKASPASNHTLSYEELVQDPSSVFEQICDYLTIPYEEHCIQGGDDNITDPRDPFLSQPIQAKTKSWETYVTKEEAHAMETVLSPQLNDLDYTPYSEAT